MGSQPSRERPLSAPPAVAKTLQPPLPPQAAPCSPLALALCDFPSGTGAATVLRMGEQLRILAEWLYEGVSRQKAEELLLQPGNRSGSFLIRESQTRQGFLQLLVKQRREKAQPLKVKGPLRDPTGCPRAQSWGTGTAHPGPMAAWAPRGLRGWGGPVPASSLEAETGTETQQLMLRAHGTRPAATQGQPLSQPSPTPQFGRAHGIRPAQGCTQPGQPHGEKGTAGHPCGAIKAPVWGVQGSGAACPRQPRPEHLAPAGCYSLSVRHAERASWDAVTHYSIHALGNGWLYISPRLTFPSLHALVDHYSEFREGLRCLLREPCSMERVGVAPVPSVPAVVKKPLCWDKINSSLLSSEATSPPEDDSPISPGLREAIRSYRLLTETAGPGQGPAGKGAKTS
ncbi:src-like-adapter 2 isoform X2 [Tyto alba]|uniref:src-like-adapter 2 isoform X2 n=1 Tax=Tyto alba TaxID=56313 RepID=UPI001C667E1D|nr:src-like-adapter 2 isoform X2 [Tyto alba]